MIRTVLALGLLTLGAAGCALLQPASPRPRVFVLGTDGAASAAREPGSGALAPGRPTALLLGTPAASPGFDTPGMIYVTRDFELQAFANHQWVDAPQRMLAPLLVQALEAGPGLTVVQSVAATDAALRLDTQVLRLQQEFIGTPSRVRFELRAELSEATTGRILATQRFEAAEDAPSEDPYGGVVAANAAVARVVGALADWVAAQAAAERSP